MRRKFKQESAAEIVFPKFTLDVATIREIVKSHEKTTRPGDIKVILADMQRNSGSLTREEKLDQIKSLSVKKEGKIV